jgi:hydroxylamine reductase
VGNYGGAWQNQQHEFAQFPGPILMTSNCLVEPTESYSNRLFTSGPVGFPHIPHIKNQDFSPLIATAMAWPGFQETQEEKTITIGFARHAIMGVSSALINLIRNGDIRHLFLVGGCDGAAPGRNYYSDLAALIPSDSVILTLGCNKYRFNGMEHGAIAGIPRLLDMGQCNDSYSAIFVAKALADAMDCSVNALPLALVVSWFEQKAVAVLLTLLSLGIRGIRLGPTLPAFLTPALLTQLAERFDLKPIASAQADLAAALASVA